MPEKIKLIGEPAGEDLLRALNHPLRRRILRLFQRAPARPLSPTEVHKTLNEQLSNVSYHFRCLEATAVIRLKRTEPVRGSVQHFYVAESRVLALPWIADLLEAAA